MHSSPSTFAPMTTDGRLLLCWAALCTVAELLGIASAAIWYGAVNFWLGEPPEFLLRIVAWFLMTLAAVPEGLVLGGLQAYGLSWVFATVSRSRWILATIVVGLIGWGIGAFLPLFLVAEPAVGGGNEPGLAATAMFAAVFGVLIGAVFGLGQSWALPAEARRRYRWIIGNAVGWAIGLPFVYVAAQLAADQSGWVVRIALWAAGGIGAGSCVGLSTGIALLGMTNHRSAKASVTQ